MRVRVRSRDPRPGGWAQGGARADLVERTALSTEWGRRQKPCRAPGPCPERKRRRGKGPEKGSAGQGRCRASGEAGLVAVRSLLGLRYAADVASTPRRRGRRIVSMTLYILFIGSTLSFGSETAGSKEPLGPNTSSFLS